MNDKVDALDEETFEKYQDQVEEFIGTLVNLRVTPDKAAELAVYSLQPRYVGHYPQAMTAVSGEKSE